MTDKYLTLSYWSVSKNITYSLLFIFPMLFLYESMCLLQFMESTFSIRNGADVLIRQFFGYFGIYSELFYCMTLMVIFIIIIYVKRKVLKRNGLQIRFLLCMLIESIIWCGCFIIIMGALGNFLLFALGRHIILEQLYLAIGAGIWEELLFRVAFIGIMVYILRNIIRYSQLFSTLIAIIIGAFLFSYFHYIGEFGDLFTYRSFALWSIAGVFLGSLYIFRGFGITAYTHIFYDMAIISIPILFKS